MASAVRWFESITATAAAIFLTRCEPNRRIESRRNKKDSREKEKLANQETLYAFTIERKRLVAPANARSPSLYFWRKRCCITDIGNRSPDSRDVSPRIFAHGILPVIT